MEAGRFIISDTAVFSNTKKQMQLQYDNLTINDTTIQGYHVQEMIGHNKLQNLFAHMYIAIAGNRNIVLMAISDSTSLHSPALQQVFSSFTFLNQQGIAHWGKSTANDGAFTTWAPCPFRDYSSEVGACKGLPLIQLPLPPTL